MDTRDILYVDRMDTNARITEWESDSREQTT